MPASNSNQTSSPVQSHGMIAIDLVAQYLVNNEVPSEKVSPLLQAVHAAVVDMVASSEAIGRQYPQLAQMALMNEPAVSEGIPDQGAADESASAEPDPIATLSEPGAYEFFIPSLASLMHSMDTQTQAGSVSAERKFDTACALSTSTDMVSVASGGRHHSDRVKLNPSHKGRSAQEPKLPKRLKSVSDAIKMNHIICLEDGKRVKDLAEHLSTLGMSPADYRLKWDLPEEYPMMAPNLILTKGQIYKVDPLTGARVPVRG